jgi:hypothetical protein
MWAGSWSGRATLACGVRWVVSEGSLVLLVAVGVAVRWAIRLAGRNVLAQDRGGLGGRSFQQCAHCELRLAAPVCRGVASDVWLTPSMACS